MVIDISNSLNALPEAIRRLIADCKAEIAKGAESDYTSEQLQRLQGQFVVKMEMASIYGDEVTTYSDALQRELETVADCMEHAEALYSAIQSAIDKRQAEEVEMLKAEAETISVPTKSQMPTKSSTSAPSGNYGAYLEACRQRRQLIDQAQQDIRELKAEMREELARVKSDYKNQIKEAQDFVRDLMADPIIPPG